MSTAQTTFVQSSAGTLEYRRDTITVNHTSFVGPRFSFARSLNATHAEGHAGKCSKIFANRIFDSFVSILTAEPDNHDATPVDVFTKIAENKGGLELMVGCC